jgi:uncharacterized protein
MTEVIGMAAVLQRDIERRRDAGRGGRVPRWVPMLWAGFVIVALLALDRMPLTTWAVVTPIAALVLVGLTAARSLGITWLRRHVDGRDMFAVMLLFVVVVGLFRAAFVVFTAENVAGLFLTFGAGLVLGVAGPVVYTTFLRRRSLRTLGLGLHALRPTLALALVFGGVQFVIMFRGYTLPAPVDWVPLLVLSLTVGVFEAVFFRGFVQGRLEASFGAAPAVTGAAVLYALYHVGYGMGTAEMVFLFALGIVYAIAYRITENVLVLWPLLTPIGSLFNNLEAGDIVLPWASIAGFANVLAAMAVVVWLAARHEQAATRGGLP